MISSGTTAVATSGAGNTTLIAASNSIFRRINIVNEGAAGGFASIDNGNTWFRIPPGPSSRSMDFRHAPQALASGLLMKREASVDMSGVYAEAY